MKKEIVAKLLAVRRALGNVYVSEEQNCLNLGGAMQMLRETIALLERCDVAICAEDSDKSEGS